MVLCEDEVHEAHGEGEGENVRAQTVSPGTLMVFNPHTFIAGELYETSKDPKAPALPVQSHRGLMHGKGQ